MITKIFLIRHAEAEGNLFRVAHGQYDSNLTPRGYHQLHYLRQRFEGVHLDAVYGSDLTRTHATASALYVPRQLPFQPLPLLREVRLGDWEERTWAEIKRRDPDMYRWFNKRPDLWRVEGAESFQTVAERTVEGIRRIAAENPGKTVAAASHGAALRILLGTLEGMSLQEIGESGHSDNTAVTLLEITDGKVNIVYMNDNSHLSPAISTLAQQHWWKKNDQKADVNLWFAPFDLTQEADRAFYQTCREEAWQTLYGRLDRYDGAGFLEEAYQNWQADPKSLTLAMAGRHRAGLLQLDPRRGDREKKGYISFLYLTPEQRHNGVGVQLIGKAVSLYRPLGREDLQLSCSEANQPALSFYEKYGFRRTGSAAGAYGTLYELEKPIGYHNQAVPV